MSDQETTTIGSLENPVILTKMAVKALGCNPRNPPKEKGAMKLLCRIYGEASDYATREDTRTGQLHTNLVGEFEGVNVEEGSPEYGKCFRSGKLFLPSGIQETVEKMVAVVKKNPNAGAVRFAIEIYSVDSTNAIGYSYAARNLTPKGPETVDAMAEIRKLLPPVGAVPQIEAPKEPVKEDKKSRR